MKRFLVVFSFLFLAATLVVGANVSSSSFTLEVGGLGASGMGQLTSSSFGASVALGQISEEGTSSSFGTQSGTQRGFIDTPKFVGFGSAAGTRASCCGPYGFTTNLMDKFGIDSVIFEFSGVNYSASFISGSNQEGQWGITFTAPGTALFSYRWWAHNKAGQWNASNFDTFEVTGTTSSSPSSTTTPTTAPEASAPSSSSSTSTGTPPSGSSETTPAPVVTPEPTPLAPGEEVLVQNDVSVEVADSTGGASGSVTETFLVEENPASPDGFSTRLTFTFSNGGSSVLENVEFSKQIGDLEYKGPSPLDYPEVSWGSPLPVRIVEGSVIAVWQFERVEPGQNVKLTVEVNKKLDRETLEAAKPAKVSAQKAIPLQGTPAPEVTVPAPASAGTDMTLPLIVLAILVAVGAYFFLKPKKSKGL